MLKRYLVFFGDHYYPLGGMKDFNEDFDDLDDAFICIANQLKKRISPIYLKENPNWLNEWDGSLAWAHIYDSVTKTITWNSVEQGDQFIEVMKTVKGYEI